MAHCHRAPCNHSQVLDLVKLRDRFGPDAPNWRGKPLISREVICQFIRSTTTTTGLEVRCCLDENEYPKAIKVSDAEMAAINISRDDFHGEWNYTIAPMLTGPDDANRPGAGFEVEG